MIATDTSSLVSYLSGLKGLDVELVDEALTNQILFLPPMVLTEILSDPKLDKQARYFLSGLPLLEIKPGFWERAGELRRKLISKGFKARLWDALITQCCLDHRISLITRDKDFSHFQKLGHLRVDF